MEHSSPVSKIVATAQDSAWAQAYSAGKLHIVLSLEGEQEGGIASLGKETLERLQREFFALDEKDLDALKKVAEIVIQPLPETITVSLVLTTIVQEILYIVIANAGSVFLKREEKVMVIGVGEKGDIVGFSGKVEPDDVIITATEGLIKTVSSTDLEKAFQVHTPHEIGESIAPLLHENATGTEAALAWKMIGTAQTQKVEDTIDEEPADPSHPNDVLELDEEKEDGHEKKGFALPHISLPFKNLSLSQVKRLSKKQVIIGLAILLLLILGGSILFEKTSRENTKQQEQAQLILTPNKQKYEDAIALMSLNKSLAIEELQEIKSDIESKQKQFPEGSAARKDLDAFLAQVESALKGEGVTGESKIQVFFDASKNSEIPSVSAITTKGETIAIVGSTNGGILTSDGQIDSTFDGVGSTKGITQDEKNVYILHDSSVDQVEKTGGKKTTIIEKQTSPISIDTFGGNIYLLSQGDKTVYKYRPTNYERENYFTEDVTLVSPSSLSIDASVYVVAEGGIKKFTRGKEDSFSYKGKALSAKAHVYTEEDYTNLYLLDPEKKTASVLDKTGTVTSEFSLKGMKNITSIAAGEKDKKIYVVADNKVYSISF